MKMGRPVQGLRDGALKQVVPFNSVLPPIIGIALGNTDGVVPGMELDIAYKKLDYYSETEYVIDFDGEENNFLYK
jgi:hypothetical protein